MEKIFVTGGSGFIAKHILAHLFEKGYSVRASVRSQEKAQDLKKIFPNAPLDFAFLDMTNNDGWNTAMDGCTALIHTASPFPLTDPKNKTDLIEPAVDGTGRALKEAYKSGITRIILTQFPAPKPRIFSAGSRAGVL